MEERNQDISVTALDVKMKSKDEFFLLDVRQPEEYEEYNMGATLIPLGELPNRLHEIEQYKNSEVIVHCRSGARSANAKQYLIAQGFENVRNLLGGAIAWVQLKDAT